MPSRTDLRQQIIEVLDRHLPDAADDAAEIARLESELRDSRETVQRLSKACSGLSAELLTRNEGDRDRMLRELWTALGVPAQIQALCEVKRLQRQASEVLRITGAQSHEEAMATVRALYHAAAAGAEVAGELLAVKKERDEAREDAGRHYEQSLKLINRAVRAEQGRDEALKHLRAVVDAVRQESEPLGLACDRRVVDAYSYLSNAGNPAGQRAPEAAPPPASGARNPSAVVPACPDCGSVPDGSKCCIVVIPTPSADSGIAPAAVEVGAPASTAEAQR